MVDVAIVMGSKSDEKFLEPAVKVIEENGLSYEVKILSAHRNPDELREYIKSDPAKVFIAMAGFSAALPGFIAAYTQKPVIGVPLATSPLAGVDSILSMIQMPKGIPVAVVGVNASANAAHLAVRIVKG